MVFAVLEVCFVARIALAKSAYPSSLFLTIAPPFPLPPRPLSEQFVSFSNMCPFIPLASSHTLSPQWIQSNNGYAYNHRVEDVKGGDNMHQGTMPASPARTSVASCGLFPRILQAPALILQLCATLVFLSLGAGVPLFAKYCCHVTPLLHWPAENL